MGAVCKTGLPRVDSSNPLKAEGINQAYLTQLDTLHARDLSSIFDSTSSARPFNAQRSR
jgi:hypothetical protein